MYDFDDFKLDNPPAKLTLTMNGETATHEWPGSDVSVSEILEVLSGMMVAHTFGYDTVLRGMKDFLEEKNALQEEKMLYDGCDDEPNWTKTTTVEKKK